MAAYCLIYSTHPDPAQAQETATRLVQQQRAACCNILPPIQSHYVWEGTPTMAEETPMLSKTTAGNAAACMQTIAAMHPHDCPAILQIPLENGYPPFLQWITAQTLHSSD